MNNEEKFKKSLQNKIESKEFPFDETEWDKAAALIDASKKGNNRAFLFFMSSVLLLLLGYVSFNLVSSASHSEPSAKISKPSPSHSELHTASAASAETTIKEAIPSLPLSVPQNRLHKTPADIKRNEKDASLSNQSPAIAIMHHETATPTSSSWHQAKTSEITETSSVPPSFPTHSLEEYQPTHQNGLSANESNPSSTENEITTNHSMEPTIQTSIIPAATAVNEANQSQAPGLNKQDTVGSKADITEPSQTQMTNTASLSSADTTKPLIGIETKQIQNKLTLELGTAYVFGWKNQDGRDANGFSPVLGLNYHSHILNNYWLSVGVFYTSVRNLSYNSKTSKVTRYKLGEESDVTTITPSVLHFLSFPIKVNYQLDEKNVFGAGYSINYLFNVESKVLTYTQSMNGNRNSSSYTTGGYTEGFKLFHSQVAVFYRRQLVKDLYVNTELFIGIKDLKENGFFNTNTSERNSGMRLTLSYNLFKK